MMTDEDRKRIEEELDEGPPLETAIKMTAGGLFELITRVTGKWPEGELAETLMYLANTMTVSGAIAVLRDQAAHPSLRGSRGISRMHEELISEIEPILPKARTLMDRVGPFPVPEHKQ